MSPFGQFMMDNLGYMFVSREAGAPIEKWLIHNTFAKDINLLQQIYEGTHPKYVRIKRVDEIRSKKFNF